MLHPAFAILKCHFMDVETKSREGKRPSHGHPTLPAPAGCSWMKSGPRSAGQRAESLSLMLPARVSPPNPSGELSLVGRLS